MLYYIFDINDLDKPEIENSIYFIRNKSIGFVDAHALYYISKGHV